MNPPKYSNLPAHFWDRVEVQDSGCWEWIGYTNPKGYGRVTIDRRKSQTHRLAYIDVHGEIPEGMLALHHCDNPPCVRSHHLYTGTPQDNSNDMVRRGRSGVGINHPNAKLTDETVLAMRAQYANGDESHRTISDTYGVPFKTTSAILGRTTWKHLDTSNEEASGE